MYSFKLKTKKKAARAKHLFLLVGLCATIYSCKKESSLAGNNGGGITPAPVDSTIAPSNFDFRTTRTVTINVNFASNSGEAIKSIPVNFYANGQTAAEPVFTALTDANGAISAQVELPAYVDTLVIDPAYIGLARNARAAIQNNSVSGTIGGSAGISGGISASRPMAGQIKARNFAISTSGNTVTDNGVTYVPMGTWDSSGVPSYLVSPADAISAQLLSYLNASLPETVDVRKLHPQYLQSTATADLNITEAADVWITFVSEGAGYLNTLGYYTYPTGQAPKTASDIKKIYYMYPNASLPGSGGNLKSGSKVKLGTFNAGTSIGFVIIANGYSGGGINTSMPRFFTTSECNPETSADLKRHTVLLQTPDNRYCIGFEDINRQSSSCDQDFNDVIIYATSNPVEAISNYGVQKVDTPQDSDGDGVVDSKDAFPKDPARAYINYYPSQNTFGTLAFEDLWPATGDYDMNDLVVNYRYKIITNGNNQAVEMYADYTVQAAGASFLNGFGVQFPFSPGAVKTVTGQKIISNYVTLNANGTEASQGKAVIIPFDNYQALAKRPGGYYVNTQNGAPYVKSDTAHLYIGFNTPLSASALGNAPFNPFLISNLRRGYEVHLPNNAPTDLADKKLLGTSYDRSNPAIGVYYKTKYSWPWALNFAGPFNYSTEGTAINKTYNYFLDWAKSGGTVHTDWYLNTPANANSATVYRH